MKKIIITSILVLISPVAHAVTCNIPSECKKVLNASFSAGGDKTIINYVQLTCETKSDEYKTFTYEISSWAGLFGLNRFTVPNKITYTQSKLSEFECKK
jgi:hypothetical protein